MKAMSLLLVIVNALFPIAFVIATAGMSMDELRDWRLLLGFAFGLLAIYVVPLVVARIFFRQALTAGSLQANCTFPNICGQKLRIGAAVALNTVLKNLAQPAVMWLLALLLGVTGANRREMILLGALPTASMTAMFAVQYKVYTEESDATFCSALFSPSPRWAW